MSTHESLKKVRKHPYRTAALGIVLGAASLELIGLIQNLTHPVPKDSCLSPVAVSDTYVDHSANLYAAGIFTTGVIARGELPQGALGVRGSFKHPDASVQAWNEAASEMIRSDSGKVALKFAIGGGDVQFGVQVVAPKGSPLCNKVPDIAFAHLSSHNYFHTAGKLPWPNIANAPANVFGNF